jgi:hypothetical protein
VRNTEGGAERRVLQLEEEAVRDSERETAKEAHSEKHRGRRRAARAAAGGGGGGAAGADGWDGVALNVSPGVNQVSPAGAVGKLFVVPAGGSASAGFGSAIQACVGL